MKTLRVSILALLFFWQAVPVFGKTFKREIQTIDIEKKLDFNASWTSQLSSNKSGIRELLTLIEKSPAGKLLVKKANRRARQFGHSLEDLISVGDGSLTDTTLVRRFSPDNPWIVDYESRSKVIINRNLSLYNAVLDLAHELTHFTRRDAFNPYESQFSLAQFVRSTIEGKGGEVEAYMVECQVFLDLFSHSKVESKCHQILDLESQRPSRMKAQQEFYKLGEFSDKFKKALHRHHHDHRHFQEASSEQAEFISSAYGLPYPLAAIQEYESIMERVCDNDAKRLGYYQSLSAPDRSPASNESVRNPYDQMLKSHQIRCQNFLQ